MDLVGKENANANKEEIDKKNQEVRQEVPVEDDWVSRAKNQLVVEVETQQAHYVVAEPPNPFSRIKRETPLPVGSVIGFAILSTLSLIQRILRNLKRKKEQKNEEEAGSFIVIAVSFFVITYLFTRGIELGQYVVGTDSCDILNDFFSI